MALRSYLPLDNSSIIYPPTEAKYNTHVFRISMQLKIKVNPVLLQRALNDLLHRLPYFNSKLSKSFFWYYLVPRVNVKAKVFEDGPRPCQKVYKAKELNGFLFRVSYYSNRIAVDFFHALTDGGGGKIFFLSLVARYLELEGYNIEPHEDVISIKSKPQEWEQQDQFQKLYNKKALFPPPIRRSFQYSAKLGDRTHFISAAIDSAALRQKCKSFGYTISEVCVALLLKTFLAKIKNKRRPVQISVPIGLRPIYDLKTFRNFSLFAIVSIDPRMGDYTFEELLKVVHLQLQMQLDKKELARLIRRNVNGERMFIIKIVPLVLKKPFFKFLSDYLGDYQYTTIFSNLGKMNLPLAMENLVERVDFFLPPTKRNGIITSMVGFKDMIYFNFNSYYKNDTSIEREVLTTLVEWGIPVKVYSNKRSNE